MAEKNLERLMPGVYVESELAVVRWEMLDQ